MTGDEARAFLARYGWETEAALRMLNDTHRVTIGALLFVVRVQQGLYQGGCAEAELDVAGKTIGKSRFRMSVDSRATHPFHHLARELILLAWIEANGGQERLVEARRVATEAPSLVERVRWEQEEQALSSAGASPPPRRLIVPSQIGGGWAVEGPDLEAPMSFQDRATAEQAVGADLATLCTLFWAVAKRRALVEADEQVILQKVYRSRPMPLMPHERAFLEERVATRWARLRETKGRAWCETHWPSALRLDGSGER